MALLLSPSERRILDLIWRCGPIARTDLATLAGMTAASVTRLVRSLADRRLVEESVHRVGARGQPTRPVSIDHRGATSVGLYFSHRRVEMGLVDLSGRLLHEETLPLEHATPEALADLTRAFLTTIARDEKLRTGPLLGIGVAVPGDFIDGARQLHAHAFFPELARRDAFVDYARAVPEPVLVENDAASATLGERVLGAAQKIDSFLFVHIGHGVGGGVMIDGRLVRGVRGNAGMVGIQFPNDRPRPSGQDLLLTLRAAKIDVVDFADLAQLDPRACAPLRGWINRAGAQLREQLSITARLFDPEAVIIGGRLPLPLLQLLTNEVAGPGFCDEGVGLPAPRVICSTLGPRAGVIGAATLPIFRNLLDWREEAGAMPGLSLPSA